ncbi:copper resistance protein B [Alteriqipengyuania sp. NZ-12B]|uniref:Copper resistance protein B n=1 Tax=Alteriqipengyuania abyssalis TaxID=2860200 RepID=A0ABS7PB81_9SPHN|nr:copper resistance protein B [Alteriqipengyuania abyssalis]MBY8336314.1 copper resistance protein B [Alteriqipengyuania abyssalis]
MIRAALLAGSMLATAPLAAQHHSAHGGKPAAQPAPEQEMDHCAIGHLPPEECAPREEPQPAPKPEIDHCAMGHLPPEKCPPKAGPESVTEMDDGMAGMDHSSHGSMTDKSAPGAAAEEAVPARALEGPRHAADAIWGREAMELSREQLARENGGMTTGMVLIERLEARIATDGGEHGYLWDVQGWYGGDIDRFVLKTEGEGGFGGELEDAEIQALYSRAIGPYFDLQAGVRFDPEPDSLTHLVLGVQGLAPYMFHVDGALFLSDRGDLTARIEAEYDQKITQRLILQPRIEAEFAAQDIPERGIGAGITKVEPGLRLRYEIVPEFAPYVGIEYEAKAGETADIARANGNDPDGLKAVIGLRVWF